MCQIPTSTLLIYPIIYSISVLPSMVLQPHCSSDKAFVWNTPADFADEEPKPETLAIKFGNPTSKFISVIDSCRQFVFQCWKLQLRDIFIKLLLVNQVAGLSTGVCNVTLHIRVCCINRCVTYTGVLHIRGPFVVKRQVCNVTLHVRALPGLTRPFLLFITIERFYNCILLFLCFL